jgi:recombinational DNA repair protein RecR
MILGPLFGRRAQAKCSQRTGPVLAHVVLLISQKDYELLLPGDGTALYISSLLKPFDLKITRLARGLATGSAIEYASPKMLTDAITGRQKLE